MFQHGGDGPRRFAFSQYFLYLACSAGVCVARCQAPSRPPTPRPQAGIASVSALARGNTITEQGGHVFSFPYVSQGTARSAFRTKSAQGTAQAAVFRGNFIYLVSHMHHRARPGVHLGQHQLRARPRLEGPYFVETIYM